MVMNTHKHNCLDLIISHLFAKLFSCYKQACLLKPNSLLLMTKMTLCPLSGSTKDWAQIQSYTYIVTAMNNCKTAPHYNLLQIFNYKHRTITKHE